MIKNFENITEPLTDEEHKILPVVINGLKTKSKSNPVKAPAIVKGLNKYCKDHNIKLEISEPRLRKMVNYIRKKGILPVIATSVGYYVSYDKQEIKKQIESIEQRCNAMLASVDGLKSFLA
jgi:carbamoylphosphate synthase small subunit